MANADPKELVPILLQAQPNKARLEEKDEQRYMDKLMGKAKIISDSANRLWRKSRPAPLLLGGMSDEGIFANG